MCHLILLPLPYANHQIIIISIILFCGSYRLSFHFVNGADQLVYVTNQTEKIASKLKPNDEIIILGFLLQPILYIDLKINAQNIPFHLKSTRDGIAFNNMQSGVWQRELKLTFIPLVANTSFMIDIILDANDGFNISFNEQILFYVKKRESLDNVNQLNIYGNFTRKSIKIIQPTKEEDNSMKQTLIIGIAATFVVIIITGMGIFYVSRRNCIHSNSKSTSSNDHDSLIESLGSYRSNRTHLSNVTYLTGNSFLS